MIVIGDLHFKSKQPYKKNILKFFTYLKENFNNEIFLWTGDIIDTTKDDYWTYRELQSQLENIGKEHYILMGNHDHKDSHGSPLLLLKSNKVKLIKVSEELNLEGVSIYFLPYVKDYEKHYKNLSIESDYLITHCTPEWEAFGKVYLDTSNYNIKTLTIWGHIHIPSENTSSNKDFIIGVPVTTRGGEQFFNKRILKINSSNDYEIIDIHNYTNIIEINYGDNVKEKDKDNLLIINEAPSMFSAEEMYKEYYILKINQKELEVDKNKQIDINESLETKLLNQAKEFLAERNFKEDEKDYFLKLLAE